MTDDDSHKLVHIYLKSGQVIDLLMESFEIKRSVTTNEIIGITWHHVDDYTRPLLFYLDLRQIAAITSTKV